MICGQSLAIPVIVYSLYRFAHSSFASVKKYSLSVALTALYLYNTGWTKILGIYYLWIFHYKMVSQFLMIYE